MTVNPDWVVLVSAALFVLGVTGVLLRRSAIIILMSVEIMLNAANLAFITFSRMQGTAEGQIYVFFIMTLAAAEAAVGLAIIIALFRLRETTDVDQVNLMKW
jgi:NADH-quinone oxidoreductase subunit K